MGEGIGGLTQRLSSAEKRKISTAQPLSEPGSQPPKATNENDDENDLNENVPRFARSPPASQFRPSHSAGGLASLEQSFSWLNVDELKRQKYNREKEELALLELELKKKAEAQRERRRKRKEKCRRDVIINARREVPASHYEALDGFYLEMERESRKDREGAMKELYDSIVQKQLELSKTWNEKHFPPEEKPGLDLMPEFTEKESALYQEKMWDGPAEEIVIKLFSVDLMREKLQCLDNGCWLNDEVINLYLKLLRQHSVKMAKETDSKECYFHSTFFYAKLMENNTYTYSNVSRWTKRGKGKCDLFSQRVVFFPYNIQNTHWTICVAFMDKKEICFYDSMAGSGSACMKNVLRYLADESISKKKVELDTSEWKMNSMRHSVPQQTNGYDCGVFLCTFALYLLMEQPLSFSCSDMPYFRKRICVDILQAKLAYGN